MSARDYDTLARRIDASALRLISLDEFLVPPTSSAFLVEHLIPAESIVVVFGPAKSGKTFSVCDLAMHAAHGMHWHGHSVSKSLRVVFLAGEGRMGLRVRLRAWVQHRETDLRGAFHLLPEALSVPTRKTDVIDCLRGAAPDLVVVDTLNAYFGGGDENSTQDMTAFVCAIRALRDELRCSVLVIHHSGHAETVRERGSSVLRAAADVIVRVGRDEAGSGLIAFQVVDGRDIEPWDAPLSLRLMPVEIDWQDTSGEPLSTCIVEAGEQPVSLPGAKMRPLGEAQSAILEIVQNLAKQRQPNGSGEILLLRAEVSAAARAQGISRSSISSAWSSLATRGAFRLVEPASLAVRVEPP